MRRHAVTLVELLVALAIGLVVAGIAFSGVALTAQTIAAANRMAAKNQAIRVGILAGLNELDFWTNYDDPHDPVGQPLRRTSIESPSYGANLTLGHPFTPFASMPRVDFDATRPVSEQQAWRLRPGAPLLASAAQLADETSLLALDDDRGWDSRRPYQANDPRRWFHGNIVERPHSDRRFGRYAIFTNRARQPTLGFGPDPRVPWKIAGWDPIEARPGGQVDTGPFGQVPGTTSRGYRNTWQPNQLAFLHDALGSYGLADYAPANTLMAISGADLAVAPPPRVGGTSTEQFTITDSMGRTHVAIDEQLDWRLGADLANDEFHTWGYTMSRMAPVRHFGPLFARTATGNNAFPFFRDSSPFFTGSTLICVPTTRFNGTPATGNLPNNDGFTFFRKPAYVGDNFNRANADPAISESVRLRVQRTVWMEPWAIGSKIQTLMNRATMQRPLHFHAPRDWPQMDLVIGRYLTGGRWMHWTGLRWIESSDQGEAQLVISAPSTTLRGARQQRRPGTGWAVYYGFGDPRNSPTLDSPGSGP